MKYTKLTIAGVPKSLVIWDVVDYVQDLSDDASPDDVQYDFYSLECVEERGEEACVLFKYDESATGVYVTHTPHLQTLSLDLSPWAVESDVLLYALFVNAFLVKHKRAQLYDKYAPIKSLTDEDVQKMMEGVNADFALKVAHLKPAASVDIQMQELQQQFVKMQWK